VAGEVGARAGPRRGCDHGPHPGRVRNGGGGLVERRGRGRRPQQVGVHEREVRRLHHAVLDPLDLVGGGPGVRPVVVEEVAAAGGDHHGGGGTGLAGAPGGQGRDDSGVEAAGQLGTHAAPGDHVQPDGVAERDLQLGQHVRRPLHGVRGAPPASQRRPPVRVDVEGRTRGDGPHRTPHRARPQRVRQLLEQPESQALVIEVGSTPAGPGPEQVGAGGTDAAAGRPVVHPAHVRRRPAQPDRPADPHGDVEDAGQLAQRRFEVGRCAGRGESGLEGR
jgi:hypothetical protein